MKTLAFFNNKGGVGKTTLAYHLAWMFTELRYKVLCIDLDPQANFTSMCLSDDHLLGLWGSGLQVPYDNSIYGAIEPLKEGYGDLKEIVPIQVIPDALTLIPGQLQLSSVEGDLAETWSKCLDGDKRAFRYTSAFYRIAQQYGKRYEADICILDVGPNLGALNRAALIASDAIILPLAADIFSLQGMQNLGPTLRIWRAQWQDRQARKPVDLDILIPWEASANSAQAGMQPIGYVLSQHNVRRDRPVRAYSAWAEQAPFYYKKFVLDQEVSQGTTQRFDDDENCLGLIKNYLSLVPYAQSARKAIFKLRTADGAIGSHLQAVQQSYGDFERLAHSVLKRMGVLPQGSHMA